MKNQAKKEKLSTLDYFTVKFRDWAVPKIPKYIETYHLTLLTIPWSLLIIICGYLAKYSLNWFWLSSIFIIFQWVTDVLDGQLGRVRKTGLIKWGFFMDHFLDYFFLCAILISYVFTIPQELWIYSLFTLAIFGAFMVNSFLYFGATYKFKISYHGIGPTEIRLCFIVLNTFVIFFQPTNLVKLFPLVLIISTLVLIYVVYKDQKEIWSLDKPKFKG